MKKNTFSTRIPLYLALSMLMGWCGVLMGGPRSYTAPHLGFTLTVPEAFRVEQGRYGLSDFVSSDFLQTRIDLPVVKDVSAMNDNGNTEGVRTMSDSLNALVVRGPYDSYGIVFATTRFMEIDEMRDRVLLAARTAASDGNVKADDLARPSTGQFTIHTLPASSLSLKRLYSMAGNRRVDTLFTEVLLARSGDMTYGIIMRAHESMAREANTSMRQVLLGIIFGLQIHLAPDHYRAHAVGDTRIALSLPSAWPVVSRTAPFPLSESDMTSAGFKDSTMGSDVGVRRETAMMVMQLPTFQCEIFSHPLSAMDSVSWSAACDRAIAMLQPASALEPLTSRPSSLLPYDGSEHSYSTFRRNDYVRTSWLVYRFNARLFLVRIVAWQREVTAAAPVVGLLARMSVVQ